MTTEDQSSIESSPSPTNQVHAISTQGGAYIEGNVHAKGDVIGRDKVIYGDEVGRDKIVNQGKLIIQQALSAVDEAQKAHAVEAEVLAQGVNSFVQRLLVVATRDVDALKGGPYRGLIAYDLSDAEIFFGRERAIDTLEEHLRRSKLTIVQSESGAGKSSLLHAGVAPRLLTGGHLPIIVRPYDQSPSIKIKQALLPSLTSTPELAGISLRDFLQRVGKILGTNRELFIILDQFEEFFTLIKEAKDRLEFVNDLADCLEDQTLNVRWMLALRSEFFGDLAEFRPRITHPFQNDFRLNRLTIQEAREVIIKPASLFKIEYEPTLVHRLLEDLIQSDGEIAPPQMQLVCLALYNAYGDRKIVEPHLLAVINLALYRENGEARGILRNHLNRVLLRSLPTQEERELARRILTFLISSDQRRIRCTYSDLIRQLTKGSIGKQRLDSILVELVDNRLVNVEQGEEDPDATYELAHDYLVAEVEFDPQTRAQKLAEEILRQEITIQRQDQSQEQVIAKSRLEIIERYLPVESLVLEELELVRRSRERLNLAEQSELKRVKQELATQQQLTWRTRVLLVLISIVAIALAVPQIQNVIRWNRAAVRMVPVPELKNIEFEPYEVTNEHYSWCVDSGNCNRPNNYTYMRNNWEQYKQKPVVTIDAYDALNFCKWIGRTLPTAAQWIVVAPPIDEWKEMDSNKAQFSTDTDPQLGDVGTRTIAQYPPHPGSEKDGIYDLAGSVYEWTRTVVKLDDDRGATCNDVSDFSTETENVVVLGDSYQTSSENAGEQYNNVRGTTRFSTNRIDTVGFRCVSKNSESSPTDQCSSMKRATSSDMNQER